MEILELQRRDEVMGLADGHFLSVKGSLHCSHSLSEENLSSMWCFCNRSAWLKRCSSEAGINQKVVVE